MIEKEEIAKACEKCRNAMMAIHVAGPHEEWVEMTLPIFYRNGTVAAVFVYQYDNEEHVAVNDGGDIARRQRLTKEEIESLCKRYDLEHSFIYEGDDSPCDCDIYKVVELRKMQKAVFDIAVAIVESCHMKKKA